MMHPLPIAVAIIVLMGGFFMYVGISHDMKRAAENEPLKTICELIGVTDNRSRWSHTHRVYKCPDELLVIKE